MLDLDEAKRALRAEMTLRRTEAHAAAAVAASERACARLLDALAVAPAQSLAFYLPIRSELDPRPAMRALTARGATLCAPAAPVEGAPLRFRLWRPDCATETDRFGLEVPSATEEVAPEVVVTPLLAFDRHGARLGYGGGYYDRTLALLRAHGPLRAIGFGFAAQEVDAVPCAAHDAPLDLIVTERETIRPRQAATAAPGGATR